MDFNIKKCWSLIQKSKKLAEEGKNLCDYDPIQYNRLMQYFILLQDDIFCQSVDQYLKILELFLNNEINSKEFISQFGQLRMKNLNTYFALKNELNLSMTL